MNVHQFIGKIVGQYLSDGLAVGQVDLSEGTARYIIDCLSPDQTAAIAREILSHPDLSGQVDLKPPAQFLEGFDLPPGILTRFPATYFRNATIEKPVLLIANTGDEEEQSLKELTRIGAPELQDRPDLWVTVASQGLSVTELHAKWWEKALSGLLDVRSYSLDQLASYVLRTRAAIESEGLPILVALGNSLPALRLPRDSVCSNRIKEKSRGHQSAWRQHFAWVAKNRGCYLLKRTPAQLTLGEDDLRAAFEKVKDVIPAEHHPTVARFIQSPSGWNQEASAIAEIEWEEVKPLFDGIKREKSNLGKDTLAFYEEREPELLSEEDREYLQLLSKRSATEADDADGAFYEAHRNELKEDRKLKSAWDRFVYGRAREAEDFLAGIAACMESLFNQGSSGSNRHLRIRCDRATKKDLRDLNVDAGLYFATRYAGLRSLFGERVSWQVGQLFEFPRLVQAWRASAKISLNTSNAKAALQLKFILELEVEFENGTAQNYSTQLVWKFNPNTVASQFDEDWARLEEHPLVFCRATRETVSSKGKYQTVDLADRRTFVPAFDRDRGSFVSVYRKDKDLASHFRAGLKAATAQELIPGQVGVTLGAKFDAFESAYIDCIRGFREGGVTQARLVEQLEAYGSLLDEMCRHAKGDRNRDLLLRPLLSIGAVQIEGGPPAVVVAPWHPLRLAAMQRKASQVAGLVRHLLSAQEIHFGDTRLFFKDLEQELSHPFYPEVVLGWRENKPELLALTDAAQDYSLHEPPIVGQDESEDTNENPTEGSNRVIEMVQRYLLLHPHEQANMSVVLYNCDSARLPQAVVDKIGSLYEDEEDVRCQVLLRHSDPVRLRELYRAIVAHSDSDADAFNASEATQDFMARLRICIVADQAPPPDPKDGCPYDIVFSQDVIARHARLEWYPESARPIESERLVPARWSRRRPAARDDMKSVVYLCCPVQSKEGWSYLTALTTLLKGDWDEVEDRRLLPTRQLDFRDPRTSRIFEETHNLGNWVVNYDELLDRRQLLNQEVRVIRYKQSTTQGRNVVISSKSSLGLLRSMMLRRIADLNLGIDESNCRELAERFIQDASDVSGDIVLRAAKRGRSASELIGVVLSRYLLRRELGAGRFIGWYFLDDYADWLGQREERIADIMALSPQVRDGGGLRLAVLVSEAKYIESSSLAAKRKESLKQLRDTLNRIEEAVFGAPERLDRDLWLARLSDLILDGVQFPASARVNLADWRRAVREGECEIAVRGYSHIFVSDPTEAAECSSAARVGETEWAFQEVFGRSDLRELVLRFFRAEDTLPLRKKIASENLWKDLPYRKPTERAAIKSPKRRKRGEDGDEQPPTTPEPARLPDGPIGGSGGDEAHGRGSPNDSEPSPPKGSDLPSAGHEAETRWPWPRILGLLSDVRRQAEDIQDEEWLRQAETRTKQALQQFQLQAKLLRSVLTPNSALLKFAGSMHLTVEQIQKRRSELLTTHGLHVVSIRPEPGAIAIAIERPRRRIIRTPELWGRWNPPKGFGNPSVLIGVREDDGELLLLSPGTQHAPHTLIAGSTGSGKSVLMQNIILTIAATNSPAQARIVLIDPKQGVDYFQFETLPHLEGGLIDQPGQAASRLQQLVGQMDERYLKFRKARVPNLGAYNAKVTEAERLPAIWLVHDEFAEWMMVEEYKESVTSIVSRLGVKARAAGIYLVFAAQRPDANVMPMQLRANLGNRLILKVDSEGTSEIALGEPGAENLLGHGHMLAKLDGSPGLTYAQVPLVEPVFINRVVELIQKSEGE